MPPRPLLVTGVPGVGKTTLVQSIRRCVAEQLPAVPVSGFVTEEERSHGRGRTGFRIVTFPSGHAAPLARLASGGGGGGPRVGRYEVDTQSFEATALPLLRAATAPAPEPSRLLIIDEIGKMELFSSEFARGMETLLRSPPAGTVVVVTIALRGSGLIEQAKRLPGVDLVEITQSDRDEAARRLQSRVLADLRKLGAGARSGEPPAPAGPCGGAAEQPAADPPAGSLQQSKAAVRRSMWDLIMDRGLGAFPLPVHNRIPNFVGSGGVADRLCGLPCFAAAKVVKVNPDTPQKVVRSRALEQGKTLIVPCPRLQEGLFNLMHKGDVPGNAYSEAATQDGVRKWSRPLGYDSQIPPVDMLVLGCVAVSPTGVRIGKGEGFADIECAVLTETGAMGPGTLIAATVLDEQVVDLPDALCCPHDFPVDLIVTPTRVIETHTTLPRPKGLLWECLTAEKVGQIPFLQQLATRRGVDWRQLRGGGAAASGPAPDARGDGRPASPPKVRMRKARGGVEVAGGDQFCRGRGGGYGGRARGGW